MFERLGSSRFLRDVAVLTSGTAVARSLPILVSPVLARLYTPAEFGLAAVFMVLVGSVSPAICGKYEVALVLPEDDSAALELLGISLWVSTGFAIGSLLVLVPFWAQVLEFLGARELGLWILLLPVALMFTGVMTALTYFSNREGDYHRIARAQVANSSGAAVTSLALGAMGAGFWGLLVGWLAGSVIGASYLVISYMSRIPLSVVRWGERKAALARRYAHFPMYNATAGLLGGFTEAMPTLFLTRYLTSASVGHFSMMSRVVQTPLSFVSTAVSQVNLKKVATLVAAGTDARPYMAKVTASLVLLVSVPTVIAMLWAPPAFALLFGEEWREAGRYLQILMPALGIRFVVATLSTTIGATEHNRIGAAWRAIAFLATLWVYLSVAPSGDPYVLFRAVVIVESVLYVAYYLVIWGAVARPHGGPPRRAGGR